MRPLLRPAPGKIHTMHVPIRRIFGFFFAGEDLAPQVVEKGSTAGPKPLLVYGRPPREGALWSKKIAFCGILLISWFDPRDNAFGPLRAGPIQPGVFPFPVRV